MKKEEKRVDPVNIADDVEMVFLGLRQPKVTPRDPSVWSKTVKERKAWKEHRRFPIPDCGGISSPRKPKFYGRLIVNVTGLEKTTFSHNCTDTDLTYLLNRYKTERSSIVKAFWNGKEINPERILQSAV